MPHGNGTRKEKLNMAKKNSKTNHASESIFIREEVKSNIVLDGKRDGTMISFFTETKKSKFTGKDRTTLTYGVEVEDDDGDPVTLLYFVTVDWKPESEFMTLLENFNRMPKIGKGFDAEWLIGEEVSVIVENNKKDGKKYSNIKEIYPLQDTKPTKISDDDEDDDIYEDEDEDDDIIVDDEDETDTDEEDEDEDESEDDDEDEEDDD